jgi:hypothetical protein
MDIKERSKEYAKDKALDAMTAAIEQAYEDGYNDGLKHYENERLESFVDGIEYKDLWLTSGTRWATGYVMDNGLIGLFPYMEASKFSLPTKVDFEELCKECAIDFYNYTNKKCIRFTGKNGEKIELPCVKVDDNVYDSISFWLRNPGENTEKEYARVNSSRKVLDVRTFMGYKLPVLLVRKVQK